MADKHPLGAFMIIDNGLNLRLETAKNLGIPTAQILAPPVENQTQKEIKNLQKTFSDYGIQITVVFCGFDGESYADIPTVEKTVGLVPLQTRKQRLKDAQRISDFARQLDVPAIGLHIGFIPEERDNLILEDIVEIAQTLCDYCNVNSQRVHLETGQESAQTLLSFFKQVNRKNLAINFDPANMILYGSGEPIPALELVGNYVKSVHCKDAKWASNPGIEWGTEVALGEGDVNMELFLQTLKKMNYVGPLTIEREIAGINQARDIEKGVKLLRSISKKVWA